MKATLVLLMIVLSIETNLRRLQDPPTVYDVDSKTSVDESTKAKISSMNNFKTFYTSIKKITDSYQDVVTTFQQSYNKANNRVIPHEGFKNFKLISNIFITKGLKEGRF